jgi:hypothetical protein
MPVAIGSSLAIIALKSAAGFWKYLDVLERDGLALDWQVIVTFIAIGAVGSLLGHRIAARLPQAALKRGFAAFLVVMAAYILWRTLPGVL